MVFDAEALFFPLAAGCLVQYFQIVREQFAAGCLMQRFQIVSEQYFSV
jgi:hypothetical protein